MVTKNNNIISEVYYLQKCNLRGDWFAQYKYYVRLHAIEKE